MTSPADGPGGLNHEHEWNNGAIAINNKIGVMPRIYLDPADGITGLFDLPDHSDPREKRTAAIGEAIYPDQPGGKTVVYKGELEAATEGELNNLRQFMRGNFAQGMNTERIMKIIPRVEMGADVWAYMSRVLSGGLQINEGIHRSRNHPHGAYARNFQLSLRMSDPRFFLFSGYLETGLIDSFDLLPVTNYDAPADPIFTVNLPVAGMSVELKNTDIVTPGGFDARLLFEALPGGGGKTLIVDFREGGRTAKISDGTDAIRYLNTGYSTWWDELIPGIAPYGGTLTTEGGGQWKVEYYPRCY